MGTEAIRAQRAWAAYASAPVDDETLIRRHAALIDRCARRIATRVGDPTVFDEIWSAGALGLLDAARRFDPQQAVRFETFAEHRIRGAMLDELRKLDHLPRRLRADLDRIGATRKRLQEELGREPDEAELAAATGLSVEEVVEMEALQQPHLPLLDDLPIASADALADERLERSEQARLLAEAIATLPERLQILLSLVYVEGLTYKEIAQIFEVSEPRISQLHKEAIRKAREALVSRDP